MQLKLWYNPMTRYGPWTAGQIPKMYLILKSTTLRHKWLVKSHWLDILIIGIVYFFILFYWLDVYGTPTGHQYLTTKPIMDQEGSI